MANVCYNHLRIWGKDAEAFMEAAAGTDRYGAIAFDPNSIRPTPEELLEIPTNEKLPAKKQKALIKKYSHQNWRDWRVGTGESRYTDGNWGARAAYNCGDEWTPLKKHGAKMWSDKLMPMTFDAEYPSDVWYVDYYTTWAPMNKLLDFIGKNWDIRFQNFYDENGIGFCGVNSHLIRLDYSLGISPSYEYFEYRNNNTYEIKELGVLSEEVWKRIDVIKQVVNGLKRFEGDLISQGGSSSDGGKTWVDDPPEWTQYKDKKKPAKKKPAKKKPAKKKPAKKKPAKKKPAKKKPAKKKPAKKKPAKKKPAKKTKM